MKYKTIAIALVLAPLSSHAQYEPFFTEEQSIAYTEPPSIVIEALCEDKSMWEMLEAENAKRCERNLLLAYWQIQSYVPEEPEIFLLCDKLDTPFVHEVWQCMEDAINKKYGVE